MFQTRVCCTGAGSCAKELMDEMLVSDARCRTELHVYLCVTTAFINGFAPVSEELVSSGAACSCPGYVPDSCLRQRGEVGISCAAAQLLRCAAAQFPALRCTAAVHSCAAGLPPSPLPCPGSSQFIRLASSRKSLPSADSR